MGPRTPLPRPSPALPRTGRAHRRRLLRHRAGPHPRPWPGPEEPGARSRPPRRKIAPGLTSRTVAPWRSAPTGPVAVLIGERINPTGQESPQPSCRPRASSPRPCAWPRSSPGRMPGCWTSTWARPWSTRRQVLPELVQTLVSRLQAAPVPGAPTTPKPWRRAGRPPRLAPDQLHQRRARAHGAARPPVPGPTARPSSCCLWSGRKLPVTAAERISHHRQPGAAGRGPGRPKRLLMVDVLAF